MSVRVEDHGPVRHLVLDRPERRNALTVPLVQELAAAAEAAGTDDDVAVVVLRGEGPALSAGIDIATLRDLIAPGGLDPVRAAFVAAADALERVPKVTVAAVHGTCVGAGFELTLACDLRVLAHDARVGLPETRIGAVPDVGGCSRLAALTGLGRAKELILTSAIVDAQRAAELGIANRVAPPDGLAEAVDGLVAELLACSALANGLAKGVLDRAAKPALEETLALELEAQRACTTGERLHQGVEQFAARLSAAR